MRRALLAAAVMMLAPAPARAAELVFGAEASSQWDSNIANTVTPTSDFSFRMAPTARLRDRNGDLTYDLFYRPRYQAFTRFHEFNDWEHFVNGNLAYRIGPSTKVSVAQQYYLTSTPIQRVEQVVDQSLLGSSDLGTILGRQQSAFNTVSGSFEHSFSPLWTARLDVSNDLYDPKPKEFVDSSTTVAQGSLQYGITRRDRIGGGMGATFQDFEATEFQPSSSTNYYQVFASWYHEFSPTWSFDIQAGPTWVDPSDPSSATSATLPFGQYPTSEALGVSSVIDANVCPADANGDRFLFNCRVTNPSTQTFPVGGILGIPVDLDFDGFPDALADQRLVTPTLSEITSPGAVVPVSGRADSGGSSVTYFASARMTKRWTEAIDSSLSYRRNAATTSSAGVASIVDVVTASGTWRPSPLWTITLTGLYTHRSESSRGATGQALLVDSAPGLIQTTVGTTVIDSTPVSLARISGVRFQSGLAKRDIDQYAAGLRSEYQIMRNLSTFARGYYFYQQSKIRGIAANDSSYDSYTFELGLRYEFDPFQL